MILNEALDELGCYQRFTDLLVYVVRLRKVPPREGDEDHHQHGEGNQRLPQAAYWVFPVVAWLRAKYVFVEHVSLHFVPVRVLGVDIVDVLGTALVQEGVVAAWEVLERTVFVVEVVGVFRGVTVVVVVVLSVPVVVPLPVVSVVRLVMVAVSHRSVLRPAAHHADASQQTKSSAAQQHIYLLRRFREHAVDFDSEKL